MSGNDKFLLIKHGPIPSARMGGMTMEFAAPKVGRCRRASSRATASASSSRMKDGEFQATKVEPLR